MMVLTILPLGMKESMHAIDSDEPDYEDGLVRAVAELNNLDFIITRDRGAFERSTVRSLSAHRYIQLFDME